MIILVLFLAKKILQNLNTNKSTCVDTVHPKVLKECSNGIAESLYRTQVEFYLNYVCALIKHLYLKRRIS
jgi:hypothetical protein